LNKRLGDIQASFKNILKYNINLTYHVVRKEQVSELASRQARLATVEAEIQALEARLLEL
jgi:hypothetical protein